MKAIILSILSIILIMFVLAVVKGMNTSPSELSIHIHPSNFDKPPMEQVMRDDGKETKEPECAQFEEGLN